jgi:hypothetical protein
MGTLSPAVRDAVKRHMAQRGFVKLKSKLHGNRFVHWYIESYRCRSLAAVLLTECQEKK